MKELTKEEIKIIEDEGYTLLDNYMVKRNGKSYNMLKLKHNLCGKIYETRKGGFLVDGKRCTCQRKHKDAAISNSEEFQKFLNNRFGDNEYTLLSNFINRKSPVKIKHRCGFEYEIKRAEFLMENGKAGQCPICNRGMKQSRESIQRRLLENNINVEVLELDNNIIKIRNNECGHIYTENFNDVLRYKKLPCPICKNKYRKDIDIDYVKKEISDIDNEYSVESNEYIGTHDLLMVKHHKCGHIYPVSRTNFLSGKRCPYCANSKGFSTAELEILDFIKQYFPDAEKKSFFENGKKKYELDVFVKEKNIGFEYNGLFWHSSNNKFGVNNSYHINKTKYFKDLGIRVVHIFSDEWRDTNDIVKDKIKSILGLQKNKIYARKCTIKEISANERNDFLNKNHIQGADRSSISLGLFYNDLLVAVMSFSKLRKALGQTSKDGYYELSRYAGLLDYTVVGGFSKLLKYAINNYNIEHIITYADLRWTKFENNVYEKNGFILDHISKPSYYYTSDFKNREYRFKYRKSELKKLFPNIYSNEKSENQIMEDAGYIRVYDCGNLVYTMDIKNENINK